jgi:CRISPR-associated protein Cst2
LCALGEVAGNHGRFLFDFSPESVVFRLTHDPAPRILYAFECQDGMRVACADLLRRVKAKDVLPAELVIGGAIASSFNANEKEKLILTGAALHDGVRTACAEVCRRLEAEAQ